MRLLGLLQPLELKLLDTFLRLRPAEETDARITLIAIDEADLQAIGSYPIPDQALAELITRIQQFQPRGIGLDLFRDLPIEPGQAELAQLFSSSPNLRGIERSILPPLVMGPASFPDSHIGFVDVVLDRDGFLRRDLLGAFNPDGDYRFSLTIRLVEAYFKAEGITLENGYRNPDAMRFGDVELDQFQSHTGPYVGADAGGYQILVNPRSGSAPFQTLSFQDILSEQFPPELLQNRLVLIGVTAPSKKDQINSGAIQGVNPSLVSGVEFRAHAVSQLISAIEDQRPLLHSWPEGWEYAWLILWGLLGLQIKRWTTSPLQQLGAVLLGTAGLSLLGYALLLGTGLLIPIVPPGLTFLLNGTLIYGFYLYEESNRARLQERQMVIERSFDAIHNGPLQSLAEILRHTRQADWPLSKVEQELTALNQELRQVYESMRLETQTQGTNLYLRQGHQINLNCQLHELLYEVYIQTLEREFLGFQDLKLKVVTFEPLDETSLTAEQKQDLCRFLQEALCNVGKYALGMTRLTVICKQQGDQNIIQVMDNGQGLEGSQTVDQSLSQSLSQAGQGSRQAQRLAQSLGGLFERRMRSPKGTICELQWPIKRPWKSRLFSFLPSRRPKTVSQKSPSSH